MRQLTFAASFKHFLTKYEIDSKICRILVSYMEGTKFNHDRNIRYYRNRTNVVTDNFCNYLNFRKNGYIGYLPNGKECLYNDNNDWKKENRQDGKPAKVIKKLFNERAAKFLFCDTDFEIFANLAKKEFNGEGYQLEVLSRHHIKDIYNANICEGGGSLNGSCMNGDISYLDIYEDCEKLQIIVLWNKQKELCGRALLWQISDKEYFMDRVYTVKDFEFEYFLDYAKSQKYWYKLHYKTYGEKTLWINPLTDEVENKIVTIKLNTEFDEYPYIDTFSYGDEGTLNNNCGEYEYNNTNGTRSGGNEDEDGNNVECMHDGDLHHVDDCYYISSRYRLQYNDGYIRDCYMVWCTFPDGSRDTVCVNDRNIVELRNGDYYHFECNIVEIDGDYYDTDDEDICYCDELEQWMKRDECTFIDSVNMYYDIDSEHIVKVNGEYRLKTDEELVCIDGEYYDERYSDGKDISSYVNFDGQLIWYKIGDTNIVEVEYLIFMDKRTKEYKDYKKAIRKYRRNKLGRKNRTKKITSKN